LIFSLSYIKILSGSSLSYFYPGTKRENAMRRKYRLWIIFFCCVCICAWTDTWQPEKTVACLIGILEWKDTSLAVFDKQGREDARLSTILQERGVSRENIRFLKDKEGTLQQCNNALIETAKKGKPDSVFFFYYAGHGIIDRTTGTSYFLNYDCNTQKPGLTCLSLVTIGEIIKNHFQGKQVILCADCCYSGNLNKVAGYLEKAGKDVCVFSSATSSNYSTGQWTFTMAFNDVLSGEPCVKPGGGNITGRDAGSYIYKTMKYVNCQMSNFYTTAGFSPDFIFSPIPENRVLPASTHIGEYKEAKWQDQWYLVRIIGHQGAKVKIHYPGYSEDWDEWVPYSSLREITFSVYPRTMAVSVEWDGEWYAATILKVRDVFHYITYDGYGDEWNEWVTSNRIMMTGDEGM
jgi:hypothetical protein